MNFAFYIILGYLGVFLKRSSGQLFTSFNTPRWKQCGLNTKQDDDRLILTPIIESGNAVQARQISKVNSDLFLNVLSFSGYLTVNQEKNSNLFFWFFPAQGTEMMYTEDFDYDGEDEDSDFDHPFLKKLIKRPKMDDTTRLNEDKPVVLWLQGGPGSSSLFGLFAENGPFVINDDLISIRENPYSWHKNYSILYIDNPVGTGFSYTRSDGYATNVTQVAKQLYTALTQFFKMFPFLESNDFFIAGESYAGKYIPALGNEIFEQNQVKPIINLQGIALGNAISDPNNMNAHSDFAYQTGLIGRLGFTEMKIFETLRKHYDASYAKIFWEATLHSFLRHSNYKNMYNILDPEALNLEIYLKFINKTEIRNALHVGNQEFSDPSTVWLHLQPDFLNSAMPWTERLLNAGLRIMYYNGNLDFIVAYPLSQNTYQQMRWNGAEKYRTAYRKPFHVNGKLKGYVTKADNFIDAVILNAGHMVPRDQPEACLALLDKFFKNTL